jgi:hypothetical protein
MIADGTLAYTPKATMQWGGNRDGEARFRQVEKMNLAKRKK